ncbi:MAG: hypothetical protein ACO1ON_07725, partial [Nocardioides sp.]
MPLPHRSAAAGAAVTLLLLLTGCTGSSDPEPTGPSSDDAAGDVAPVTLADLPVRRMAVARAPFCSLVPGSVVAEALDVAEAPAAREDRDGDRIRLGDRGRGAGRDVAHEHGCTWRAGGAEARAWVAVPPRRPGAGRRAGRVAAGRSRLHRAHRRAVVRGSVQPGASRSDPASSAASARPAGGHGHPGARLGTAGPPGA